MTDLTSESIFNAYVIVIEKGSHIVKQLPVIDTHGRYWTEEYLFLDKENVFRDRKEAEVEASWRDHKK